MFYHISKITTYIDTKFKTSSEYILNGSFWLSMNMLISSASAIALAIVLGNVLDASTYGAYKYMVSVLVLVGAFSLNGFKTVIAQTIAKGQLGFFIVGTQTFFKWSIIMTVVSSIGAIYYFTQDNMTLAISMGLIAIFAPFYYTLNLYGTFAGGIGDFKLQAKQNLVYVIVPTIAVTLCAFYTQNALYIFLSFLISSTFINGIIYYSVWRKITPTQETYETEKNYGIHLSLMSVFSKVAASLDNIIVFQFLGATQLAIYSFAFAIPKQLRSSHRILGALALPRFSNRSFRSLQVAMLKKLCLVYSFLIGVIIIYWISAPYIFNFIFPQYMEAVPYSQYLSLMILTVPTAMLKQALTSHMQRTRLYFIEMTTPLVRLVSLFVFIQLYNLWGVIMSLLIVATYQITTMSIAFFTVRSDISLNER